MFICSGNYYIPINYENSTELINETISLTNLKLLLSPDNCTVDLLKSADFDTIFISEILDNTNDLLFEKVTVQSPLYAILTSGSTGHPKVILKNHMTMTEFINNFNNLFYIGDTEIIGSQIPFYSDAAQKELYLLMCNGCRIILIPQYYFTLPYALIGFINNHNMIRASKGNNLFDI